MAIDYMHEVPGRLRVRCRALRKNLDGIAAVKRMLESASGVTSVTVNAVTGSFTIYYQSAKTSPAALLDGFNQYRLANSELQTSDRLGWPSDAPASIAGHVSMPPPRTRSIAKVVVGLVLEKAIERSLVVLVGTVI